MKKRNKKTVSDKVASIFDNAKNQKPGANTMQSVKELITSGFTRTGLSGYSRGWARKSIWTTSVIATCKSIGLHVVSGNDAPRCGANGEYVMLVADKRKNNLLHKYHIIIARAIKINAAKRNRIYVEDCAKASNISSEIENEFQLVKAVLVDFENEITASKKLTGEEKSKVQAAILKSIMQKAKIDRLHHFWAVWKKINEYAYVINCNKIKAESELKWQRCKETGETFVTKEMFHEKTKACYHGINEFLKQKFGTDEIDGLPLSEVISIVPEQYANRLIK